MTQQSNRIEVTDPKAYQAKLKQQLAGRNPLDIIAQTPDALERLVRGHSAAAMRARPFAGKWTPNEVLGHLLDTEWTFGYRIRTILCDEEPVIVGMDQERWVSVQRHNEREPAELLAAFRFLRQQNVALWRRVSPEQMKRIGKHVERGPEPLELILQLEAGHDLSHIDQLERYLAAAGGT